MFDVIPFIQNIHSTQIEVHNLNDSLTQTKFEVKVSEFTVMYLDIPHHIKKKYCLHYQKIDLYPM